MLSSFTPTIYVQLSPERLTVRNAKSGESISEVPEIAITQEGKEKIVAVGTEAHSHKSDPSIRVSNPFAHPRTLVGDFTLGEQVLKAFLRRLQSGAFLALSPRIVLHPLGNPAGGYTQVEARALHEMAIGAGASNVVVWQGRALSDQEILSGQFPPEGKVLT